MPIDHKRINGPDETLPYYLFSKLNTQSLLQKLHEVVKNDKRQDNRSLLEHRKICKLILMNSLNCTNNFSHFSCENWCCQSSKRLSLHRNGQIKSYCFSF